MPQLSVLDIDRIDILCETLRTLAAANEEITLDSTLSDPTPREIAYPPQAVVDECHEVLRFLHSRGIECPRIAHFIRDPSPFDIESVISELKATVKIHRSA